MTPDEIADNVFERTRHVTVASTERLTESPLSRREMEVAELVAEGATRAPVARWVAGTAVAAPDQRGSGIA